MHARPHVLPTLGQKLSSHVALPRWNEEDVQKDIKSAPFKVTEGSDGGILINLM
jgi:hypothetical protein